jgi:hypothetical protein
VYLARKLTMIKGLWNKYLGYLFYAVVFSFVVWVIYVSVKKEKDLFNGPHLYTVGTTTTKAPTTYADCLVSYTFAVNGVNYEETQSIKNCYTVGDGHFIVIFKTADPSESQMLFNNPVDTSLVQIPESGWTEIPKELTR